MWHRIILIFLCTISLFGEESPSYQFAGKHFIASYLDCDLQAINDLNGLTQAMEDAVKASGATILNKTSYEFPSNGLSIVYLLSESHASIHTYPEYGACFVDLFTCGTTCSAQAFDDCLQNFLRPKKTNARCFLRNEDITSLENQ